MAHALEAFSLGAAAILTNACVLPLYPGLIAFLAGGADDKRRASGWLGLIVLLGVLTMMLVLGLLVYLLQQTFAALLPIVLPLVLRAGDRVWRAAAAGSQSVCALHDDADADAAQSLRGGLRLRAAAGADDAAVYRADHQQRIFSGREVIHVCWSMG